MDEGAEIKIEGGGSGKVSPKGAEVVEKVTREGIGGNTSAADLARLKRIADAAQKIKRQGGGS